jgi:hypothetical protein
MDSSTASKPDIEPRSYRVRPKIVTTYLILSLLVTALAAFVFFIITTSMGGLKLKSFDTILFITVAILNLGCLVSTIALFFWRKWAAVTFYALLGLLMLWYGYLFLIQEKISLATISGFFTLAVLPILLFRWAIQKIWHQLI